MYAKKLKGHKYAQAQIVYLPGNITILQSYNTFVLQVDAAGWLHCNGLYSCTTIKHIGWFMRELYGLSYQIAKMCWVNGREYNVRTGKWRELA